LEENMFDKYELKMLAWRTNRAVAMRALRTAISVTRDGVERSTGLEKPWAVQREIAANLERRDEARRGVV
jgi:hypothetical protein